MTCDICGSKKNVKAFYGLVHRQWYKECRDCFEKVMARTPLSKESIEAEWKRGKENFNDIKE